MELGLGLGPGLRGRRAHDESEVKGPLEQALLDEEVGVGDHVRVEGLDLR